MSKQKIRIRLKAFDHQILDQSAEKIVETANRSNVLVVMSSENAPGDQWGNNFSNESRIGEGFAKTGKTLAKVIAKQIK